MAVNISRLQRKVLDFTGCQIQHDGWSCNSCFHSLDGELKLKKDIHEYWLAVLFYRGDYDDFDWGKHHPNTDVRKFEALVNEFMEAI